MTSAWTATGGITAAATSLSAERLFTRSIANRGDCQSINFPGFCDVGAKCRNDTRFTKYSAQPHIQQLASQGATRPFWLLAHREKLLALDRASVVSPTRTTRSIVRLDCTSGTGLLASPAVQAPQRSQVVERLRQRYHGTSSLNVALLLTVWMHSVRARKPRRNRLPQSTERIG
jgi:hypothetical protein